MVAAVALRAVQGAIEEDEKQQQQQQFLSIGLASKSRYSPMNFSAQCPNLADGSMDGTSTDAVC